MEKRGMRIWSLVFNKIKSKMGKRILLTVVLFIAFFVFYNQVWIIKTNEQWYATGAWCLIISVAITTIRECVLDMLPSKDD
jgi:hypothetical protein